MKILYGLLMVLAGILVFLIGLVIGSALFLWALENLG